jgi:hypothetical protein
MLRVWRQARGEVHLSIDVSRNCSFVEPWTCFEMIAACIFRTLLKGGRQ